MTTGRLGAGATSVTDASEASFAERLRSLAEKTRPPSGSPALQSDVLVIGAGAAGLSASIEAARLGARVVLLEKNPQLGGSTAWAIGSISAAGTRLQRKKRIQDDVASFRSDMDKFKSPLVKNDNPVLRDILAQRLAANVDWLESLGVGFVGPFPEPPHGRPRMHNVVPAARLCVAALHRAAKRQGVRIVSSTRVRQLLQETNGRVVGAVVQVEGGAAQEFRAERAVILATGDYSASKEIKRLVLPPERAELDAVNPTATGDGHLLAASAGAELVNMDSHHGISLRFPRPEWKTALDRIPSIPLLSRILAFVASALPEAAMRPVVRMALTAFMAPEVDLYRQGAILVNRRGQRFVNELDFVGTAVAAQPAGEAFLIFDQRLAKLFSGSPHAVSTAPGIAWAYMQDYARARPDLLRSARTIAELAEVSRMSPAALERTVDAFNRATAREIEDAFGREPANTPIREAPFHALGPVVARQVVTEGGLSIDEECRVLTPRREPIPGLFGAGAVAQAGMTLAGHGLHIGWAVTSGRIAGASAARMEAAPFRAAEPLC